VSLEVVWQIKGFVGIIYLSQPFWVLFLIIVFEVESGILETKTEQYQ